MLMITKKLFLSFEYFKCINVYLNEKVVDFYSLCL
jgi:hypothetical protein